MGDIRAVLLVPTEGDPLGLIRGGPCGVRPPMVVDMACHACGRRWWEPRPCVFDPTCRCGGRPGHEVRGQGRRALALAWDGEPVAEGLDRAARAWKPGAVHAHYTMTDALWWQELAAHQGFGDRFSVILLDADGREVTP